jgi:nitronate monooxygenase
VDAVRIPVIASGGIMDGRGIVAAEALGASAVQLGTAFLACPETTIPASYKRAVLTAQPEQTMVTRAFSGRPARGIRNAFMQAWEGNEDAILPFPIQNAATRPMRTAAAAGDNAQLLSLWAGQATTLARQLPAAELVAALVREVEEVRERISRTDR